LVRLFEQVDVGRPFCGGIFAVTSNASISSKIEWQSLSETPRQLCDELIDAERLIDELFEEMQRMRQEMAQVRSQRDQLTADLEAEESTSEQCKLELATVTATLEECRTQAEKTAQQTASELAAVRTEARESIEKEKQQASAAIEQERERANALIEQDKERTHQAIQQEREQTREAVEREKQQARESVEKEQKRAAAELEKWRAADAQALEALQRELADATSTASKSAIAVSQLENKFTQLEVELDLTRTTAAENKRQWNDCQRELAAERASRQGDLAELRRLLERFFERWSEDAISRSSVPSLTSSRPFVPVAPQPAPNETSSAGLVDADAAHGESATPEKPPVENKLSSSSVSSDPVVHSVMAQFSKLQKDVARRRGKRT
jgi:chromosome segregation ATPase